MGDVFLVYGFSYKGGFNNIFYEYRFESFGCRVDQVFNFFIYVSRLLGFFQDGILLWYGVNISYEGNLNSLIRQFN